MLERPPGGTTIRRPAGLIGMSSGVGGPEQREEKKKRVRMSEFTRKKSKKVDGEDWTHAGPQMTTTQHEDAFQINIF